MGKIIHLPELHPLQQIIDDDPHRFLVVSCGRRWGKTYLAIRKAFKWLESKWNTTRIRQRGWIVSPTFPLVREDWLTAEIILKDAITKKKETQMVMEFEPFGFIEFKSADREDEGLRGAGLDFAVVDEASRVSKKAWEQGLRPALADKQGKAIFISTPKGRNWFYDLYKDGQRDNPMTKSWQHPTYSNPYFPQSEWDIITAATPELILKQEYLAEFLEDEGRVFHNIKGCLRGTIETNVEGESYTIGVDLAKTHDFTVITVIRNSTAQLVNIHRSKDRDWSLQKKTIRAIHNLYPRSIVHIDATGLGNPIEEDLRKSGVNIRAFKFTNSSKNSLIEELTVAIEQNLIGIPDCKETSFLISELEDFDYEVTDFGNMRYNAPEGRFDDGVISLGLAVQGMSHEFYRRKLQKVTIPVGSPAYLLEEKFKEDLANMHAIPRRLQKYYKEPIKAYI